MKKLIPVLSLGVLALLSSSMGMAAAVTATSNNYNPLIGQQFVVTLRGTNFSNVGGATVSMSWDATKASLLASSLPDIGNGPVAIGTGTFLIMHPTTFDLLPGAPPVDGDFDFAVFTFQGIATGAMGLVFGDDGGILTGWFDNDTAEPIFTSYNQALISVQTPVPAAVWLFGSALGVMGWMRRKATA